MYRVRPLLTFINSVQTVIDVFLTLPETLIPFFHSKFRRSYMYLCNFGMTQTWIQLLMQILCPDLYFALLYPYYSFTLLQEWSHITVSNINAIIFLGTETSIHHKKPACVDIIIVKVLSFEFSPLKRSYMDNEWLG